MKKITVLARNLVRLLVDTAPVGYLVRRDTYSLSHLRRFREYVLGPIQRDEALLLFAIVRTVDPKTIVEFGFHEGHSTINFLRAMSPDARLYSYDISENCMGLASKIRDERFRFILKSQTDFEPSDVDGRLVDFVFFDASHDFDINVITFERILQSLSERALIAVHDTGTWCGDLMGFQTKEGHFVEDSIGAYYIHQPGERRFVNYVKTKMGDFNQIHLHSTSRFRHGMTLLQRNADILYV